MQIRFWETMIFASLIAIVAGCAQPSNPTTLGNKTKDPGRDPTSVTQLLFEPQEWPRLGTSKASGQQSLIVPLCHLTVLDKVDVSSNVEGTIRIIGTEVADPSQVNPRDLFSHRGKYYQRLMPGNPVATNQVLVILDDEQAFVEKETANENVLGAKSEVEANERAYTFVQKVYKSEEDTFKRGAGSEQTLNTARVNVARYEADLAAKKAALKRAEGEAQRAKLRWDLHYLKTPIAGEVAQIIKQPGEGAKIGETVLQIQNTDRLRVEGYLDLQYQLKVRKDMPVYIEPAVLEPPIEKQPLHPGKSVTAIAVAKIGDANWVVSGGEDGMACLWRTGEELAEKVWRHTSTVRAIACTRPTSFAHLALIGCEDGKAHLYDLTDRSDKPLRSLEGTHEGGVQAAAFSPDGTACVTADERGDLYLWDTRKGTLIYRFPHEHNSSVSALHFLPQCRIVSVGRDNSILVWKVGNKTAAVERTFENRSGEVGFLGVADDGSQLLIDQYKDRLNIVELDQGRTIGTLQQPGEAAKFKTFAIISPAYDEQPESRLFLTAGGSEGVVQLWRRLPGSRGRGSELRKLIIDGYVAASVAAFSPTVQDGIIAVGTRKGDVMVWKLPTPEQINARYIGKITHVDSSVESGGKTVRVFAEFDNPSNKERRLLPGTTATMVIPLN